MCHEQIFLPFSVDPPKVIQHPNSQTASTGRQTTFTIEATGDDPTFQWQKNGRDVHNDCNYSGTDTNTLSIRQVKKSDEGFYRCLVMNDVKKDGILSEHAQLSVCKFKIIYKLGEYSYKTTVYGSIDLMCIPFL